ncbi:hypothetical protein SCLCIDRAFT_27265 [Scleroderma citrinum Foug A]|uniref:Uncharacterized protein n=1 Tax=Scleroderma citrinum Foug A TaxID=1036808 RepID=A0A0C3DUE8_9AGAM|nr:hypothetical protein SCLCIDRAFT_27265 [Scleroderma citrinum Foug A]
MDTLCVKVYSNNQTGDCFAVGFRQFFGSSWIHAISKEYGMWDLMEYAQEGCDKMLSRMQQYARFMDEAYSEAQAYIMQTHLRQLTLHTCVMWKSQRDSRVKLEVFQDPDFGCMSGEWTVINVEKTDDLNWDWRVLMLYHRKAQDICWLDVDRLCVKFSKAPKEQLGDYGRFMDCEDEFCLNGNIFADLKSLPLKENITPSQHRVSGHWYQRKHDRVLASLSVQAFLELYKPLCLSFPMNDNIKTLLTSLSTRSTNEYLVTRVIQCPTDTRWPGSSTSTTPFCTFVKPFIWRRNAGADSVTEGWSGDETMGNQARVNDMDGMEL